MKSFVQLSRLTAWKDRVSCESISGGRNWGITTFAVTHVDDAFLLTFFFARRIPTRRIIGRSHLWVILIEYAALVALLCFRGWWLGSHLLILRSVNRCGHWVVPLVFVGLGIYVLGA